MSIFNEDPTIADELVKGEEVTEKLGQAVNDDPSRKQVFNGEMLSLFDKDHEVKIVKMPPRNVLSTELWGDDQRGKADFISDVPAMAWRSYEEDGETKIESNTWLIHWDDNTWTLMVGDHAFKVMERPEEVCVFQQDQVQPLHQH